MKQKNLAVELLKKLIAEQVAVYKQPVKSCEDNSVRRPAIDFYKCGLRDGDELVCTLNSEVRAIVQGEHKVLYKDELTSLTGIMKEITGKKTIAGPNYFTFNGELLTDIAEGSRLVYEMFEYILV